MTRIAVAAALAAALGLTACGLPDPPARFAFVYGVSIYDTLKAEGVNPNLTLADDDAEAMAALLASQGWDVTLRTDADATRDAIEADIGSMAGSDALVLFYYSGHGDEHDFGLGEGFERYLLPHGAIVGYAPVAGQAMSPADLFGLFEAAGLQHVVALLDCCFSGGFAYEGPTVDAVPPSFGPNEIPDGSIRFGRISDALYPTITNYLAYDSSPKTVVITAAGLGESSWERDEHGLFTGFLLESATAGDMDGDGAVTTGEIYAYTSRGIMEDWNADHEDTWVSALGEYADFHPHQSGGPLEYVIFTTEH